MLAMRKADDRGHANHGWLDSYHSFSFGGYYDPEHMGVSNLRVINDDTVAPGGGFAEHGHHDMEIISYVLDGALEHRDSMGNGSVIRPGDVQHMSAGTGVTHSEYNHSSVEPVHFLQIWLQPNTLGVDPGYAQKHFPVEDRRNRWRLLVSPDGRDGSIATHQDALMFGSVLAPGEALAYRFATDRRGYLHLARGRLRVGGITLRQGDGLKVQQHELLDIEAVEDAEVLLFDLP
ncbi:MAG: pirin family protein [Gammaproteobacteria bacterium]|nr:pirin family protein [Gammaproteobacteria bacterium]